QVDPDILVAPAPAVDIRDALVAQTEHRRRLGTLRNIVLDLAVDGRHNHLVAQYCLREGNWDLTPDVKAVALKQRVWPYVGGHIDICRRAAIDTVVALSTQHKGLAIVD